MTTNEPCEECGGMLELVSEQPRIFFCEACLRWPSPDLGPLLINRETFEGKGGRDNTGIC